MRLYTLEQARALLPAVVPVVERLRQTFIELRAAAAAQAAANRGASGDGNLIADAWASDKAAGAEDDRLARLSDDMQSAANALEEWGIEIKDPARGLVDFRSERGSRVVYLCYELGEDDIRYWHDLEAGFAGRQPL